MEALVTPFMREEWMLPLHAPLREICSAAGETPTLEQNMLVEQYVLGGVLRPLSKAEMDAYRAPFIEPGEGRRPTLTWPRQIPIEGELAGKSRPGRRRSRPHRR